jgi:hypothetical protein
MGKRRTGLYVAKTNGKGGEPIMWKYRELGNPKTVWIVKSLRVKYEERLGITWREPAEGFEVYLRNGHQRLLRSVNAHWIQGDLLDAMAVAAKMLEK